MLKRLMTQIICLLLAWTTVFPAYAAIPVKVSAQDIATLQQRYPHARVIHVSPDQYPALRKKLLREGYLPSGLKAASQYRLADNTQSPVTSSVPNDTTPAPSNNGCNKDQDDSDNSFQSAVDITNNITPDGNSDSDSAAVLFIIIGTVVLVIWTLYVVRYFVNIAMGNEPCGRWSELSGTTSTISAGSNQHAYFDGVRYLQGIDDGGTDVGISAELGNADILLTDVSSLHLQGLYWFVGPMLRWNMTPGGTPNYFQLEFVAGSTEHSQMGIIAVARMGLNFGTGNGFRWGLNFGAMNINLHANQGIITHLSQYYYVYGLNFGYRF